MKICKSNWWGFHWHAASQSAWHDACLKQNKQEQEQQLGPTWSEDVFQTFTLVKNVAHTDTYMTVNPSRGKLCDTYVTTAQYPLHTSQLTSFLQETIVQSRDRLLQVKMDPDFVPIPVHVIKTRPQYHHPRDNLGRDGDSRCGYTHPPGLWMVAS